MFEWPWKPLILILGEGGGSEVMEEEWFI